MNARSRLPERGLASGTSSRWVVATDGCPVSSFVGVRQTVKARRGEFSPTVADARSLFMADQSRPYPLGSTMAASSSKSRSTMACKAAAVAVSRRLSGRPSYQAAYSDWLGAVRGRWGTRHRRAGERGAGRPTPSLSPILAPGAPPRAGCGAPVPRGDRVRRGLISGEGRGKRRGAAGACGRKPLICMVSPVGLEPTAPRLKVSCSTT